MWATPWGTTRFSLRLGAFFSFLAALAMRFFPRSALLLGGLLLAGDRRAARPLARAGVGMRALTADRQTAAVTGAAVRTDLHQPLDVLGDLLAQVTLHAALVLNHLADATGLVLGEL